MTDDEIKELATRHGWWGVDIWWREAIPQFRGMIAEVTEPLEGRIAELEVKCQEYAALALHYSQDQDVYR